MLSKAKENVIMRVYQPSQPFPENRIPKKLISGVIEEMPHKSKRPAAPKTSKKES